MLELEQNFASIPAYRSTSNSDQVLLTEGQSFKVETSPNGNELCNVQVPAGKQWLVTISVAITETDV